MKLRFFVFIINWLSISGRDWTDVVRIWQQKYPVILSTGWCFWLPTMCGLYYCVSSVALRFALLNIAAYIWQVNLAYMLNRNKIVQDTSASVQDQPIQPNKVEKSKRKGMISHHQIPIQHIRRRLSVNTEAIWL